MDLPRPAHEALRGYQQLASDLSQWAPTVHRLVRARITALQAAYGPLGLSTETDEQFAGRVLAQGQYPFPEGTCIYDDTGYAANCNTGYDHIDVNRGIGDDGDHRITYTGRYPHWSADGESYEMRTAEIYCPGWLVTDPDGIDRYTDQTAEMVRQVEQRRAQEEDAISALMNQIKEER